MRLVAYKCDDHAVEVEEEHDEVKPELDKGFALVDVEFAEDFRGVEEVLVVEDPGGIIILAPVFSSRARACVCGGGLGGKDGGCIGRRVELKRKGGVSYFFALYPSSGKFKTSAIQYPLIKNSAVRKA